jgi:hypothetical protein
MERRSCGKYCLLAVFVLLAQGVAATPVRAYTFTIISESYLCQVEIYYNSSQYEWSSELGREILVWNEGKSASQSKKSSAAVSFSNQALASASVSSLENSLKHNLGFIQIEFSVQGHVDGNYSDPKEISAHSKITGELEFMLTKDTGDIEDIVTIPLQIQYSGYEVKINITLNGKEMGFSYGDMAFPLGLNTLQLNIEGKQDRIGTTWLGADYGSEGSIRFWTDKIHVVPLPSSILLFGAGLVGLAMYRRRKMSPQN